MKLYKAHKLASIFPVMNEEEMVALRADMREHGYRPECPITLYDGEILDGRNRYEAAQIEDVKPAFVTYEGDDPLGFVISLNLNRRHLNETQRAGVAAKIANMEPGGDRKSEKYQSANLRNVSQPKAAEMLNVSRRTVQAYKAVERDAPDLVAEMDAGRMTVHEAGKAVRARKRTKERGEIANAGKKVKASDKWNVYHADMKTWKAPKKYDFIITDPPYPKEFLPLYGACQTGKTALSCNDLRLFRPT